MEAHPIYNPLSVGEFIRQDIHTRLLIEGMGLLPPSLVGKSFTHILDLGCGPGTWLYQMSQRYERSILVGTDPHESLLKGARTRNIARKQVSFDVWDPLSSSKKAPFPEGYFDLITLHFASRWVSSRDAWSALLATCRLFLKEGGTLLLVENNGLTTTSPALRHLDDILAEATQQSGHSLNGTVTAGITLQLNHLLATAGYQTPSIMVSVIDFSYDHEQANRAWRDYFRLLLKELTPFLLSLPTPVTTLEELQSLTYQIDMEMFLESFVGLFTIYRFVANP